MTLHIRRPALADAPAVVTLARALDIAIVGESEWTEEDLLVDWEERDLEQDAWLILAGGRLAGYAALEVDGDDRLVADGYVHPELVGHGVGARIVELTEARARERSGAVLENAVLHDDRAAGELLRARGYEVVRHFVRMVLDLDASPAPPEPIAGIEFVPFAPADGEAFHRVLEDSFAGQWRHRRLAWPEWRAKWLAGPWYDPTLWWLARAAGEPVGVLIARERYFDSGWIARVGVVPDWRGRGIAPALLRTAFAELYERGERRMALGVDTANSTGAARVYERVGMRVLYQADIYEKALTPR